MNFDFSEEQVQLRAEARRFLAATCPSQVVRDAISGNPEAGGAVWESVARQGWLGATIPEQFGGLGLGYLELCCIAEEMGRAAAPVPFASTLYFFAEALLLAGTKEQKSRLLPLVATGHLVGAFATSEGPGPLDNRCCDTEAREGKLTGIKIPVTDGNLAHFAIVLAREGQDISAFIVNVEGQGVTRERLSTLDPARDAARLVFADALAERLGGRGEGATLVERIFDRAAILLAFEQVGGADRCLEMARDFAVERFAFGRPIGSFQAIKHKLADVYIRNVVARSNAYYGAWALQTDASELPQAAAVARIAATDAYWYASKENIQTHGGMGFTWEADCHLHYRRAKQLALVAEPPRVWKERLIRRLERRNAA